MAVRSEQLEHPSESFWPLPSDPAPGISLAAVLSWQLGLSVALWLEAQRIRFRLLTASTPGTWWDNPDPDGTCLLPLLLLAPLCWLLPVSVRRAPQTEWMQADDVVKSESGRSDGPVGLASSVRPLLLAGLIAVTSLLMSMRTWNRTVGTEPGARRFGEVLPLVHDEFSYLLQARTILAGKWYWAGPERAPELFHQQHVLNEGRFASRYLPGTGAWIAPWLALGHPLWGHWLAGAAVSVGMFILGCQLQGTAAGVTAGLLTAVSPGMTLLNNLLLAHQPCLVGLTIFLIAMFRVMAAGAPPWAWLAGSGLAFAMLCRPLTAAAVGFPFGAWWLMQCLTGRASTLPARGRQRWQITLGLGVPLLAGLLIVGWQNRTLTGDAWTTPYSLYTRLYTPRHRYGFHNGAAVAAGDPSKVLRDYDNWASDLNGDLALENLLRRLQSSLEWSLGLVPLTMAAVFFALTFPWQDLRLRLVGGSIACLHAVSVPYWLDGMLHHHYVFETGPLWLLIFSVLSVQWIRRAWAQGRLLFPLWWGGVVLVSVAVNHVQLGSGTTTPRIAAGCASFLAPTEGYRVFVRALANGSPRRPALILVQQDRSDLHAQFVRNDPPFDSDLLVAIDRPELYSHSQLSRLFPERTIYLYDSKVRSLTPLTWISTSGVRP